jgi:hypothetical protein
MFRLGVSVDDPLLWLGLALQIVGYVLAGVLLVRLREKVTGRASAVRLWWRRLLGMLRRLLRIGRDVQAARADFRNLIGADLNWELLAFAFIIAGTVLTTIAA